MSVLKVKNGNQWDIVLAIKGDPGDPAADESITDDMLVTDGIKTEIEWLWGNQLTDSREGEILHAEDAYTAPAFDISVDGKSTQVTTTGKNLLSDRDEDWEKLTIPNVGSRWVFFIPVEEGQSYTCQRNELSWSLAFGLCDDTSFSNYIELATFSNYNTYTFTNTTHSYLVASYNGSNSKDTLLRYILVTNVQVEIGAAATSYEPYSELLSSPRPDLPQEIVSVDNPEVIVGNKQLIDWSNPFRTGAFYYDATPGKSISPGSSSAVNVEIDDNGLLSITINTAWCGASFRTPNLPLGRYNLHIPTGIFSGSGNAFGLDIFIVDADNVISRRLTHQASFAGKDYSVVLHNEYECALVFSIGLRSGTSGTVTFEKPIVELGSTATEYEPYLGNTASLLPDGYSLRSLPDGTKDELHLSYLRPSKREGWAWYSRELVKRVGSLLFPEISWTYRKAGVDSTGQAQSRFTCRLNAFGLAAAIRPTNSFCSAYAVQNTSGDRNTIFGDGTIYQLINYASLYQDGVNDSRFNNVTDFLAANENTVIMAALITPTTETLDPIELPIMPSRTVNVWSDPATNLKMTYIQDSNLIIENLEATIADIATS